MKALVFLALLGAAYVAAEDEKVVGGYECPGSSVPDQVSPNAGPWVLSAARCYESLQWLRQPVVDDRICRNACPNLLTENMLCSGFMQGGASSCQVSGPQGGPPR
ncbi:unnamed protein product [Tetraodon nigroviridis]|uniref:(spotted green pufferfish) hypothetical protein n=1 Tax=Tetraodon nigroviridis TaxID=99883 RepID=Q4RLE1_TETNG|nr:unnamed protein product [Tetraodon nigroviridis]